MIPDNVISHEPVTGLDWWKTFAAVAGADIPSDRELDGFNVWPLLTGLPSTTSPRPFVPHDRGKGLVAISNRGFKQYQDRLIDIAKDQSELIDVSQSHPKQSNVMKQQMKAANASIRSDSPMLEPASKQSILTSIDRPYLNVTAGESTSFTISLKVTPDHPVNVRLRKRSGSDTVELTPQSLTFTPENWNSSQTVTVASKVEIPNECIVYVAEASGDVPVREIYLRHRPKHKQAP